MESKCSSAVFECSAVKTEENMVLEPEANANVKNEDDGTDTRGDCLEPKLQVKIEELDDFPSDFRRKLDESSEDEPGTDLQNGNSELNEEGSEEVAVEDLHHAGDAGRGHFLNNDDMDSCLERGAFDNETDEILVHHNPGAFSKDDDDDGPMQESGSDCNEPAQKEESFICDLCGKCCVSYSNLLIHMRLHTGEKPYSCDSCDKCFTTASALGTHKHVHDPQVCDVCEQTFPTSKELKKHKRESHTSAIRHTCETCGKFFLSPYYLNTHRRVHTGERPYPCEYCGKPFMQSSGLAAHKRIHTGEKPYACNKCGKTFITSSNLNVHLRVHSEVEPYKCEECGRGFLQLSGLVTHRRLHTGERPFSCDVCNKKFVTSSHLKVHKRVHTREKPYKCEACGKCFVTSSVLILHKRVHTGERPYVCDICGQAFVSSSNRTTHRRKHGPEAVDAMKLNKKSLKDSNLGVVPVKPDSESVLPN